LTIVADPAGSDGPGTCRGFFCCGAISEGWQHPGRTPAIALVDKILGY
jgi:hypothetical protein